MRGEKGMIGRKTGGKRDNERRIIRGGRGRIVGVEEGRVKDRGERGKEQT